VLVFKGEFPQGKNSMRRIVRKGSEQGQLVCMADTLAMEKSIGGRQKTTFLGGGLRSKDAIATEGGKGECEFGHSLWGGKEARGCT